MTQRVRIERLGHRGDGVAEFDGRPIFITHVLPGELVDIERTGSERAQLINVIEASPQRAYAFIPGEAVCGGCGLRHISVEAQLEWKGALVAENLRSAGIDALVEPCIDAHGHGRRRATFHARRGKDGVLRVGFTEARSHDVVDLGQHLCPVMSPGLQGGVEPVRGLAKVLANLNKPIDAVVTVTRTGLDVSLRGVGAVPEKLRLQLVERATAFGLARLSLHDEILVEAVAPVVQFGKAEVVLPSGGFLQATEAGENILAALVLEGVGPAKRVADLFSGSGTFALRLAETSTVRAVESDRGALSALERASRRASGLKKVDVEGRDLFQRPLQKAELAPFDAVVFDPPRVGAEAQSRALAESKVGRVVAVSCNPATLARDLKALLQGGFQIDRVVPVDQFRHSAHVEAVAVLSRR
jgi:23S rRNA (uracil1939-C5)-methyltransferase